MADSVFEYDVFLSFASGDEDIVRPVWQHLMLSGLRVFWSDATLRERVGISWFDVIQDALARSRHLVLVCTRASLESKWVKREYVAFFNHHFAQPTRRLVPLLTSGVSVSDLPLFLRELEAVSVVSPNALTSLVRALGGVDLDGLNRQLAQRDEEIALLRHEVTFLKGRTRELAMRNQHDTSVASVMPKPPAVATSSDGDPAKQPYNRSAADVLREFFLGSRPPAGASITAHIATKFGVPEPVVAIVLLVLIVVVVILLGGGTR